MAQSVGSVVAAQPEQAEGDAHAKKQDAGQDAIPEVLVFRDEHGADDHYADGSKNAGRDKRPPAFLPAEVNNEEGQAEKEHPHRAARITTEQHGEQREGAEDGHDRRRDERPAPAAVEQVNHQERQCHCIHEQGADQVPVDPVREQGDQPEDEEHPGGDERPAAGAVCQENDQERQGSRKQE